MTPIEQTGLASVPVFPLPNVVLFPNVLLPLHIFEPRYRAMLADCLAAGGAIVVAQVDRSSGNIAQVAGAGTIARHQPLPDGRSNIIVAGTSRVRLDELVGEDLPRYPYKRARTSLLHEVDTDVKDADLAALLATATMFVTQVKKHDPSFTFHMPKSTDAGVTADACAFQLVVDAEARQAILEELDPRTRVRLVMDQLALQHGAILGETKGSVLH